MRRSTSLLCAAGLSLAVLSACSEEQAEVEQADPPAAVEESAPETGQNQTGESETSDALQQIREGVESLSEGSQQLAQQALEDAGPALERAGEIAGAIGSSVNEIVRQTLDDLDEATARLEERIAEATGDPEPVTGDPDAVLAPADQLNADTSAAARAGPAGVGPDYVGVWAADAASCARIDQDAVELFAVITPSTIRRYESVCNFEPMETAQDSATTVKASCIAEASVEEREIVLETPSPDTLRIVRPDVDSSVELIRCHLPQ